MHKYRKPIFPQKKASRIFYKAFIYVGIKMKHVHYNVDGHVRGKTVYKVMTIYPFTIYQSFPYFFCSFSFAWFRKQTFKTFYMQLRKDQN